MITEAHAADLATRIQSGERRALAQGITLVESSRSDHRRQAAHLLDLLLASAPANTVRLGISGPPGVGKSTFIEAAGLDLLNRGHRLAVLAVDPTSKRTGGSILGDKTRMPGLAAAPNAFVRPSPAGRSLGGVTESTASAVALVEAAGYDIVIIETVGIGQSETAVCDMADLFLLLQNPGGGDELQGIKRGVMELADVVAVTKADGDLLPAAQRAAAELRSALHLMRPKEGRPQTEVLLCSAHLGDGVEELIEALMALHRDLTESGAAQRLRSEQAANQMWNALQQEFSNRMAATASDLSGLGPMRQATMEFKRSPRSAAMELLDSFATESGQ